MKKRIAISLSVIIFLLTQINVLADLAIEGRTVYVTDASYYDGDDSYRRDTALSYDSHPSPNPPISNGWEYSSSRYSSGTNRLIVYGAGERRDSSTGWKTVYATVSTGYWIDLGDLSVNEASSSSPTIRINLSRVKNGKAQIRMLMQ